MRGVTFSAEGLAVIREAEELAHSLDTYVYPWTFMAVALRRVTAVRSALARQGMDPDKSATAFDRYTRELEATRTSYDIVNDSYSSPYSGNRQFSTRAKIIDLAIAIAQRHKSQISGVTIFGAVITDHDDQEPLISLGGQLKTGNLWTAQKRQFPGRPRPVSSTTFPGRCANLSAASCASSVARI